MAAVRPAWLEEPFAPAQVDAFAALRDKTTIPRHPNRPVAPSRSLGGPGGPSCDVIRDWHWRRRVGLPRVGRDEEVGYGRNVVHDRGQRQLYGRSMR